MPDFWRHSGYHLTTIDQRGALVPGDDLLRAYFARPEVAPVAESCTAERALFARLVDTPRARISEDELAALADADARENYSIVLRFRDHLLDAGSIESAYRSLFVDAEGNPRDFAGSGFPPMFLDQLVQMIMRGLLEETDSGLHARAAELFFREQRAHVADGQVLLADLETVESQARAAPSDPGFGNIGRLLAQAQTPLRQLELDVLGDDNADTYWSRDERHDTALQLGFGRSGQKALCQVISLWVGHFHGVATTVRPLRSIESARMRWFVGLDSTATVLLNGIYNGLTPSEAQRRQILCMMELTVDEAGTSQAAAGASGVYLALAMDEQGNVRMKPQNLLTNLPFRIRL